MGRVITSASMSLDGYIAKDDNTIGLLFDWLQNGPVEIPTVNDDLTWCGRRGTRNQAQAAEPRAGPAVPLAGVLPVAVGNVRPPADHGLRIERAVGHGGRDPW